MGLANHYKKLPVLFAALLPLMAESQINFVNSSSRLSPGFVFSGNSVAVVDMDGDGLDDIATLDRGYMLRVEKQRTGQQFLGIQGPDMQYGLDNAWGMMVGDMDGNGYRDVSAGFYGLGTVSKANDDGSGFLDFNVLPGSNFFFQNMNHMDVDNDGDIDLMGCDDNNESVIWVNDGTGTYTLSNIINFDVSDSDDSGNYGSLWTDFDNDGDVDLYIAKCRQGVNSADDPRRINVLFVNNGNGTYTENAQGYGLRIGTQSWTANFEDINNDGWFDAFITNHDAKNMLLTNDGTGHFMQVPNPEIGVGFTPLQSKMADFDNDGFVDILVTGYDPDPTKVHMFRNKGNGTFLPVENAFPGNRVMNSFAVGDLNHDGRLDIYASYCESYNTPSSVGIRDQLLLNNTQNANHFVTFDLRGTVSNHDALGARVFIYGAWGVQTREVRAGESYGTINSFQLHFGLGSATVVDSAVIRWPAGGTTRLFNRPADQFITVVEGQCASPDNKISYAGSPAICSGQSITLNAPAGYTYRWSNGDTTQSIQVSDEGEYNVRVSGPGNCSSVSATVKVGLFPAQVPVITSRGNLKICPGGEVLLEGPPGMGGYQWSDGTATQNLTVTQNGTYTLTVQGICDQYTSDPVTVEVLGLPTVPEAADVNLALPGTATLVAAGNGLEWYASPAGGLPLATGNTYITPILEADTVYYVQAVKEAAGNLLTAGMFKHLGGNLYSSSLETNATTKFTVTEDCILRSVKVYTDKAGQRLVVVKNTAGAVVASAMVNIPATGSLPFGNTRIPLNFRLPPGSYTLGTDSATNKASFGFAGPRLQRSTYGVNYPYTLAGVLSITGSNEGSMLYYYFYDWEVEVSRSRCASGRKAVHVRVGNSGLPVGAAGTDFYAYPNPTAGVLNIKAGGSGMYGATLRVVDVTGKTVWTETAVNMPPDAVKTLDVSALASGIYTLQLHDTQTRYTAKFIIR